MVFVDFDYNFLATDVGVQWRISNRGIFKNFELYHPLQNKTLKFPLPSPLPLLSNKFYNTKECTTLLLIFVGNDAFQLTKYCMKSCGCKNITNDKHLFDSRLLYKCRLTENTFGIWVNMFRIFSVKNNLK